MYSAYTGSVQGSLSPVRRRGRLEVNMGDAIAQMAQDRLRIQALEVNPPVLFAIKQRSEGNSPRDLLSSRPRLWSGSSVSRNNKGGRSMTFVMAVSVGMLIALMVPRRRPRKTPGVSCRIRQRLALVLLVRVHRRRSRRLVPIQSSCSRCPACSSSTTSPYSYSHHSISTSGFCAHPSACH
jgi:hypothetical protein